MTQFVSSVRRRLSRLPFLLPFAFVAWRTLRESTPRLLLRNQRARRRSSVPIPPGHLIFSATGTRDVEGFLKGGRLSADSFRVALEDIGRPIASFRNVLEFGCSCGRVLRQWSTVKGPNFYGTDYNPAGPEWGKRNLPWVTFGVNRLHPPLDYPDAEFDLVYAVSVFTHFPREMQRPWIEEMHRIIAPGGILMLTLSGEGDFPRLTAAEQQQFRGGDLVVLDPKYAGTNVCAAYHPQQFVRKSWGDLFAIRKFYREGALGSPRQDLYVFERL